ncbi:MAG: hypothetical protein QM706_09985 [Nitrospira sp.]
MRAFVLTALAAFLMSCGVVGPPVPPELVGVTPTINKQKREHAVDIDRQTVESAEPDLTLGSPDMDLPPSQPVGIR